MATSAEVRRLLGQCLFIGFDGLELSDSVSKLIREYHVGGINLFACNYQSPAQVAELINALQATKSSSGPKELPLAIAVDHEGGKVQRFKKPFIKFPEARIIGDHASPKLAFECATVMGKELKTVGVNVIYGPVADINTNPSNPVIGRRAFGETEEAVSRMVSGYIRGFITCGVSPVVKHFPGHGDTTQDSHFHLPKVQTPLETLMDREFKPFLKSFRSRCEMVMTAHIIMEAIDPGVPATMSSKILQDILRGQLRYRGLILSDDMEMKAVTDHFGEVDAAILALEAGVDILLYHTEPFLERVLDPLLTKLTSPAGKRALSNIEASVERITKFKTANFLPYKPVYIPEIEAVVGCEEHKGILKKAETGDVS